MKEYIEAIHRGYRYKDNKLRFFTKGTGRLRKTFFKVLEEEEHLIEEFAKTYMTLDKRERTHIDNMQKRHTLTKCHYYCMVWSETMKNISAEDNNRRSVQNHLDHIYAIHKGYINNIDYKIIGGKDNIQIISMRENFKKGVWK